MLVGQHFRLLVLSFTSLIALHYDHSLVLLPGGRFICCVPVPERNKLQSIIRGVLYSEAEYETMCREHGFKFESIPCENGALLYFRAVKQT